MVNGEAIIFGDMEIVPAEPPTLLARFNRKSVIQNGEDSICQYLGGNRLGLKVLV